MSVSFRAARSIGDDEIAVQAVERRIANDYDLPGALTLTSLAWFGDEVLTSPKTRRPLFIGMLKGDSFGKT
jgi:hypothetical protein